MIGFVANIEELTFANENFRKVIYTGQHVQLVLMSLLPNEEIGMEVHGTTDQFLRIEKGEGKVIMNGEEQLIKDGSAIVVPAGTQHNIINTSSVNPMKLYTVYSPPHHKDGIIHKTKQDAETDTTDHL
jgi:mannose-6-phosphate isomerase-like protein (cupin superfamily)